MAQLLDRGQSKFRAESLESLLFWTEKARACTISGACYHKMRAEFERWNLARACMPIVGISDTAVERTCMQSEKRLARMHDWSIRLSQRPKLTSNLRPLPASTKLPSTYLDLYSCSHYL